MGKDRMELKHLVTFRTLAEELSFTQTAVRLNYAQSSVSAQIQALEDELGAPLVERLERRLRLTAAGEQFLDYTQRLLSLADEAYESVAHNDRVTGTITIGAVESLCTYRLAPVLKAYRTRFPHVNMVFRTGICADLRKAVWHGSLDLALTLEAPITDPGIHTESLCPEPMRVLAPPDHPLTSYPVVAPNDFVGETLLLTEPGCSYRTMFEQALGTAGVHAPHVEFFSVEAIKQCVQAGLGITLLPAMAVQDELAQGTLVALPWSGPAFPVVMQLAWHQDKWLSPALFGFIEEARRYLAFHGDNPVE